MNRKKVAAIWRQIRASVFQDPLEKLLHGGLAGMLEKLLCCGTLQHTSLSDEGDAVSRTACEAHLVGDKDDGFAGFTQLGNHIEDFGGHLGIEGGSGFVQKQKSGVHREGPGYSDTLALTTTQLRRLLGRVLCEMKALQDIHRPITGGCGIKPMNLGKRQHDISKGAEVGKEIEGLKNNARVAAMNSQSLLVLRQRFTIYENFTRIRSIKACEQSEECGLASAGWSDKREGVGKLRLEIHGIKDSLGSKLFCETAQKDFHLLRSFSGISSGMTPKSGSGTSTISSTMTGSNGTLGATGGAARRSLNAT